MDRASVIRAAAELVNAEGVEALTINRLARDLKVQPPSLYNHIDGLPDLRRELAFLTITALGDSLTAAVIGKSGREALVALAQAYRGYIRQFPDLYQASLRASGKADSPDPELQAAEERTVEIVLAVLASFHLAGEEAIHAARSLRSAVHGFASLEVAGGFGLPLDLDESFDRLLSILIQGIETGLKPC